MPRTIAPSSGRGVARAGHTGDHHRAG